MSGAVAANFHEGSRSEVLADYLFSGWGTVTPVRRQSDHGLDLYCTLTERLGQRDRVTDYFSVQVKSADEPWIMEDIDSVRWLIAHPVPIFLCRVNKKQGVVRVHHVFPRFYAWTMRALPNRLEMTMDDGPEGKCVQYSEDAKLSLSAPIVEVGLADLIDADRMTTLRDVFSKWVRWDRENCDRIRQGLLRFRMPAAYKVNEIPVAGSAETGQQAPEPERLRHGIYRLAEALECIGGQFAANGKFGAALEATLMLDRLFHDHQDALAGDIFLASRVPGHLGHVICPRLNAAYGVNNYWYAGLEALKKDLECNPAIQRYLEGRAAEVPAS